MANHNSGRHLGCVWYKYRTPINSVDRFGINSTSDQLPASQLRKPSRRIAFERTPKQSQQQDRLSERQREAGKEEPCSTSGPRCWWACLRPQQLCTCFTTRWRHRPVRWPKRSSSSTGSMNCSIRPTNKTEASSPTPIATKTTTRSTLAGSTEAPRGAREMMTTTTRVQEPPSRGAQPRAVARRAGR